MPVPGAARGRIGCPPALGTPGVPALRSKEARPGKTRPPELPGRYFQPRPHVGSVALGAPGLGQGTAAARQYRWPGRQRARSARTGHCRPALRAPFPLLRYRLDSPSSALAAARILGR